VERSETRARQVRITPPQRMLKPFAQSPRERIQKVGPTEYLAVRYKIPRAEDAGFVRLHGLCDQFALCSRPGTDAIAASSSAATCRDLPGTKHYCIAAGQLFPQI